MTKYGDQYDEWRISQPPPEPPAKDSSPDPCHGLVNHGNYQKCPVKKRILAMSHTSPNTGNPGKNDSTNSLRDEIEKQMTKFGFKVMNATLDEDKLELVGRDELDAILQAFTAHIEANRPEKLTASRKNDDDWFYGYGYNAGVVDTIAQIKEGMK